MIDIDPLGIDVLRATARVVGTVVSHPPAGKYLSHAGHVMSFFRVAVSRMELVLPVVKVTVAAVTAPKAQVSAIWPWGLFEAASGAFGHLYP